MEVTSQRLRQQLRDAGFANSAVDAVWPSWWSPDADGSLSARTELVFTVARRLGLTASSLLEGAPEFVWHDPTKFKNLSTTTDREQALISGYGSAVGRTLTSLVAEVGDLVGVDPLDLRHSILQRRPVVGFGELMMTCWSLGIPVVQLQVLPLPAKRMHALTIMASGKPAVLLGVQYSFSARYAYVLAHELGHLALGHLEGDGTLIEMDDPLELRGGDDEERAADAFALTLLTGSATPDIAADREDYSAAQLVDAVQRVGPELGIEPGVMALLIGHRTGRWPQTTNALKHIPPGEQDVWLQINRLAASQLRFDGASFATREYLQLVLGLQ